MNIFVIPLEIFYISVFLLSLFRRRGIYIYLLYLPVMVFHIIWFVHQDERYFSLLSVLLSLIIFLVFIIFKASEFVFILSPVVMLFIFTSSLQSTLPSKYLAIHIAFSVAGYIFLYFSILMGVAEMIQEKSMKSKRFSFALKIFPPYEKIQGSRVVMSTFGTTFLTAGVILGLLRFQFIKFGIVEFVVLSSVPLFAFSVFFSSFIKNIKRSLILSLVGALIMATTIVFVIKVGSFHLR